MKIGTWRLPPLWSRKKKVRIIMTEEQKKQNVEDIMSSLEVGLIPGRTHLMAVVMDSNIEKNKSQYVKCHKGQSFAVGYPYDQGTDSYIISCVMHEYLGHVPVAYQVKMEGTGGWTVRIPLPESVINRYLTPAQQSQIATLQKKYSDKRYSLQIMQMSGCDI